MFELTTDTFDVQMIFLPLKTTRFPSTERRKTGGELLGIGDSLLATHMVVRFGIVLYHMPKYVLVEFLGVKKPNAKLPPSEIKVWLKLMDLVKVMLCSLEER